MIIKAGNYTKLSSLEKEGGDGGGQPPENDNNKSQIFDVQKDIDGDVDTPVFTGSEGGATTTSRIQDVLSADNVSKNTTLSVNQVDVKDNQVGRTVNSNDISRRQERDWENIISSLTQNRNAMRDVSEVTMTALRTLTENKAVLDWKKILKRYFDKALSEIKLKLPARRHISKKLYKYGYSRTGKNSLGHVVIAIDTSRSMTQMQLQVIINEIMGLPKISSIDKMTIIYMSDIIDDIDDFSPKRGQKPDLSKVKSGGGNMGGFIPPFKYVFDKGIKPTMFIYFTDGYADYPDKTMYGIQNYIDKTFWFIIRRKSQEFERDMPPFGKVHTYYAEDFFKKFTDYQEGNDDDFGKGKHEGW